MLKKILIVSFLMFSNLAVAGPHHGHRHHWHNAPHYNHWNHNHGWWVGPAIVGGVLGYALTRPQTVIVEQQPVIVQQPRVNVNPSIIIDGVTYTKQIMIINGIQTEVLVKE